jgi:hypothetical protein
MVVAVLAWAARLAGQLAAGCWFAHADRIRERRRGVYVHVCPRCGDAPALLSGQHGRVAKVERTPLGVLSARLRQEKIERFRRRA